MGKEKWVIDGYEFEDGADYEKALKEKKAIDHVRSQADLSNPKAAYKVYSHLADKHTFKTIIGYDFLRQLRDQAQKAAGEGKLRSIPVSSQGKQEAVKKAAEGAASPKKEKKEEKYKELYEKEKASKAIYKVIIAILGLAVAAILVITYKTPYSIFTDYEEKIIDQYEAWEQELEAREKAVTERENALKGQ